MNKSVYSASQDLEWVVVNKIGKFFRKTCLSVGCFSTFCFYLLSGILLGIVKEYVQPVTLKQFGISPDFADSSYIFGICAGSKHNILYPLYPNCSSCQAPKKRINHIPTEIHADDWKVLAKMARTSSTASFTSNHDNLYTFSFHAKLKIATTREKRPWLLRNFTWCHREERSFATWRSPKIRDHVSSWIESCPRRRLPHPG